MLLKAYEKLDTLKKEKFFRTWITRILINECNGIIRKRKNIIPYEEYMENAQMFEENRYDHLYMAIMELPENLRILVTLYYIEGFSLKEISAIFNIPEGTIKSRLSKARELLREAVFLQVFAPMGLWLFFCRMWHKGLQTLWMMISTLYLQASMRQ